VTLSPSVQLGTRLTIVLGEWVDYELAEVCAVPGCWQRPEQGSHHIVRRSDTAGPKNWVGIDGLVVPNRCRLCPEHHRMVTGGPGGHRARILWADRPTGHWRWCTPQPVTVGALGSNNPITLDSIWQDQGSLKGIEGMYSEEEIPID
jgi:hypothetical protein